MKTTLAILLAVASSASAQITCGADGKINIIGSSTVFPVSAAFATDYTKACPSVQIIAAAGGSSAGARTVCNGTAEIGNLSREMRDTEATSPDRQTYTCVAGDATRKLVQIPVAVDGVPIVVGTKSTILTECLSKITAGLTLAELRWLFSNRTDLEGTIPFSDGKNNTWLWSEICGPNPKIPATQKVNIYAPAPGFGTHDYFKEVIFTGGDNFRAGITFLNDNDAPLRDAIANDNFGIGFFGFSYFIKQTAIVAGIPVAGIAPTIENIVGDKYLPLGRRIYSFYWTGALDKTACYGYFGLSAAGATLVEGTGFLPVPEAEYGSLRTLLGVCGQSEAPTLAPTTRQPACARFCWFFRPATACCSRRRRDRGDCKCL